MSTLANTNNNTPSGDGTPADAPNIETPAVETPAAETPAAETYTKTDLDKAVAKAIKEAETKAADAEAKAKLSEDERAKAETAELRTQLRERDARDAVKDEAGKLGVKNPSAIYKIVAGDLEFDDKGKVSNLKDVMDTAKTDFPELFDTKPNQSIDGGAGGQNQQIPTDSTAADFQKTGRTNSFRL